MPVIVRAADTAAETKSTGCTVRALLNVVATGSDHIVLDHVTLAPGTGYDVVLAGDAIGWLQLLDGDGKLDGCDDRADKSRIAYLPLGYEGRFTAGDKGAALLLATVPDALRFDAAAAQQTGVPRSLDWTREPVLQSEHDARKRIYLATPKLVGTEAYKGEMIRYPPGTAAPEHHHEGAEHFQYVVSGNGTALLDGTPHVLHAGDVLYNFEHERHAFINESDGDFVFVEFFVPGPCKTVWSADANVCAWLPTGADIAGRPPVRDIAYHVHGDDSGI